MFTSKTMSSWFQALVISVVVLVLEWVGLLSPLKWLGEVLISPLQRGGVVVGQTLVFPLKMASASWDGARRIQELEQRYAEMAAKVGTLEGVSKENEELRKMVGVRAGGGSPIAIGAPIISLASPAIALPATTEAGNVTPGAPVLVSDTLMGVIQEVGERQSKVDLLIAPTGPKVLARTESGVEGIVVGDGQRPLLTEVPLDEPVLQGERVVTVGQDRIPGSLFIGRVIKVEVNPNATTQVIYLDQAVSFFDASVVEVRL
jgi:cell shape-determining protein MreC